MAAILFFWVALLSDGHLAAAAEMCSHIAGMSECTTLESTATAPMETKLEEAEAEDEKLLHLLQTKIEHRSQLQPRDEDKAACVAVSMSMGVYSPLGQSLAGFDVIQTYKTTSTSGDVDKAVLFRKGDACSLAFMGSEHDDDFGNVVAYSPISKWGISGVHSGVAAELERLVNLMDFTQIRSLCTGPFTVTGHSLGGGMAQLFSLAINKEGDPLSANLKVDFLYTFGAVSATAGNDGNDKNKADGCFAGAQYYYAEHDGANTLVDVVANPLVGGSTFVPLKTLKKFIFSDGSKEAFACGTPLPQTQSMMMAKGKADWMPLHEQYGDHMKPFCA